VGKSTYRRYEPLDDYLLAFDMGSIIQMGVDAMLWFLRDPLINRQVFNGTSIQKSNFAPICLGHKLPQAAKEVQDNLVTDNNTQNLCSPYARYR